MSESIVPYEQRIGALTVNDVRSQVNLIQHIMQEVMKKDEHYGVIPGTGTKPSLLKAGAEKLCLTFRLDPQYEITEKSEGKHLTITSKCTLYHIPSSQRFGSGMGSCSTKESKYAYRTGKRKCPECGAEQINKSKFPPKNNKQQPPGWYCYAKNGGCGAEFAHDDPAIMNQVTGRIANEDIADQYNTVLKMANKRSLVAAVLNATAASDIFTQDIEDMPMQSTGPERVITPEPEEDRSQEKLKVSPEQIEAIHTALSESNLEIEALLTKAEITSVEEMPAEDAPKAITWIKKQKPKAAAEKAA